MKALDFAGRTKLPQTAGNMRPTGRGLESPDVDAIPPIGKNKDILNETYRLDSLFN